MILTYFLLELVSAFDNPVTREGNSLHHIFISLLSFFFPIGSTWHGVCFFVRFLVVFLWLTFSISYGGNPTVL
jgi:hypothetical protein